METTFNQRIINVNDLFAGRFLDTRALYLYHFNTVPSMHYLDGLNGEKALDAVKEKYAAEISNIHTYREHCNTGHSSNESVLLLQNGIVIEFDDDYCYILHNNADDEFITGLIDLILGFRGKEKKEPREMNLIIRGDNGLKLKSVEIKETQLDLDLFYEDDFKPVDAVIRQRLNTNEDKGIVLLHGLPGAGKTTYLRHLIAGLEKRVLFLSPNIATDLMSPDFLELMIDNPNTVLVIEDAENIIMDRRSGRDSAVSNLLNISDGLLADFLNVQLICTFNSSLTLIDNALLRKGRLIAKYEFSRLSIAKAQRLSDHFGFPDIITAPMTVAEIANRNQMNFQTEQVQIIGFRRDAQVGLEN